jgi:light-regulated signal transduction histidine kinase (bacteriophytochrome)
MRKVILNGSRLFKSNKACASLSFGIPGSGSDRLHPEEAKFTQKHPTAKIELGVTEINRQVTYFVRDDGAGFEMAYVNKLFGAFQRLHDTTEFEGTGIGRATIQRIIHRHGGLVWAEGAVE